MPAPLLAAAAPYAVPAALTAASGLFGYLASKNQKPGRFQQLSTLNPYQQQLLGQAGQQGLERLQNPYQGFEPIETQARREFNTQGIPALAQRFANAGLGRSSAFQGALSSARANLEPQLAALRAQYGLGQQRLGSNLLGLGLTPSFENAYLPGGPTAASGLFGGLGRGFGAAGMAGFSNLMMNPSSQQSQATDQVSQIANLLRAEQGRQREEMALGPMGEEMSPMAANTRSFPSVQQPQAPTAYTPGLENLLQQFRTLIPQTHRPYNAYDLYYSL